MKISNFWAVMILLSFTAVSCRQDSLFFTIASETKPLKPRIGGNPTNMVVFERHGTSIMYVASGKLHWYAKATGADTPQWDLKEHAIPQPGGSISALAVAEGANGVKRLYALCRSGHGINATLRYIEPTGNEWKTISLETSTYPIIQSIFADPESKRLFAGAGKNDQSQATYGILYLDHDTLRDLITENTSILSGAVYDTTNEIYYLSTRGDGKIGGIFQISEAALMAKNVGAVKQLVDMTENDQKNSRTFMSITKLNDDTIIAVERDKGMLYAIRNGSFERIRLTSDGKWATSEKYATEAHVLWEDTERNLQLFINGIQGGLFYTTTSSQTYGYVEFKLDADGNTVSRHDPASKNLLSVDDNARYEASIGKHPINHLFQTPAAIDPNRTFFASTQTDGLWSYRYRPKNGGWQWNAEN